MTNWSISIMINNNDNINVVDWDYIVGMVGCQDHRD